MFPVWFLPPRSPAARSQHSCSVPAPHLDVVTEFFAIAPLARDVKTGTPRPAGPDIRHSCFQEVLLFQKEFLATWTQGEASAWTGCE